jgi:hypothetical protein
MHPVLLRLYRRALANQLAIAVGSSLSEGRYAIPAFAEAVAREFSIEFSVEYPLDHFRLWNEFVDAAENAVTRRKLGEFAVAYFEDPHPTEIQRAIARIPVSNFIDTTFDRSFVNALLGEGRKPRLHQWMGERLGGWKQSPPENPTVFCMLPEPDATPTFFGLHEPVRKHRMNIHLANLEEMLRGRDLLMLEFSGAEADWILNLHDIATTGDKLILYTEHFAHDPTWSARGVLVQQASITDAIERLLPSEPGKYDAMDGLFPRRKLIDISRDRQYDCFISYYSGDRDFVDRLDRDLTLREFFVWRDQREVDIGDSLSGRIQEGLTQSYCFVIVLSPEALSRSWVLEELRAAYAMRLAGELKIFPLLHKDCTIPAFLSDYRYVDFRDTERYDESISLLDRSIKNAVMRAREKK